MYRNFDFYINGGVSVGLNIKWIHVKTFYSFHDIVKGVLKKYIFWFSLITLSFQYFPMQFYGDITICIKKHNVKIQLYISTHYEENCISLVGTGQLNVSNWPESFLDKIYSF